jgi:tetratricopeptide (TPR) repeat protein
LHERALAINERVLGEEHRDTARSLESLAWLLMDQGEKEEARRLHERALAIREKVLDRRDHQAPVGYLVPNECPPT